MMNQHQSVVFFSKQVLGDKFKVGVPILTYITKEIRAKIAELVTNSILEGGTEISAEAKAKYGNDLRTKYVVGMCTNWFNKSKELNGGVKHEIKNPGSRTNPEIKTLRDMLVKYADNADAVARIQAELDAKLAELGASRVAKTKTIDADLVPDSLKDLIAS